jgi:UDP-N-acetylmuramyl pentapeptide synthase
MTEENKKEPQLVDQIVQQVKDAALDKDPVKQAKVTLKLKQSPPIKAKLYYDVKVECMLPATVTYRVLAETPEQAAELIKGMSPIGVRHRLVGKKDIKLYVYDAGSTMLRWMKNLLGG